MTLKKDVKSKIDSKPISLTNRSPGLNINFKKSSGFSPTSAQLSSSTIYNFTTPLYTVNPAESPYVAFWFEPENITNGSGFLVAGDTLSLLYNKKVNYDPSYGQLESAGGDQSVLTRSLTNESVSPFFTQSSGLDKKPFMKSTGELSYKYFSGTNGFIYSDTLNLTASRHKEFCVLMAFKIHDYVSDLYGILPDLLADNDRHFRIINYRTSIGGNNKVTVSWTQSSSNGHYGPSSLPEISTGSIVILEASKQLESFSGLAPTYKLSIRAYQNSQLINSTGYSTNQSESPLGTYSLAWSNTSNASMVLNHTGAVNTTSGSTVSIYEVMILTGTVPDVQLEGHINYLRVKYSV